MTKEFLLSLTFPKCLCVLLLVVQSGLSVASEPSALGRWRQIDDEDGKPLSIVRIEERAGLLEGHIEKIFTEPGDDPDPVCSKCPDTRRGQKIIGMKIISGLKRNGGNGNTYEGGEILDPDEGKLYRVKMTLARDGKSLEVRGFVGLALFGRSQIWLREE